MRRARPFLRSVKGLAIWVIWGAMAACSRPSYRTIDQGIVVTVPGRGDTVQTVRLQLLDDHIIRVTAAPDPDLSRPRSLMILPTAGTAAHWTASSSDSEVLLTTPYLQARVSLLDGHIRFLDSSGRTLLCEAPGGRSFVPDTAAGRGAYRISQAFDNTAGDDLYGLGENQLGITNLRGKDIMMAQHNTEAFVPMLVSSGHYGILWDNNAITWFGAPEPWLPLDSFRLTDENGLAGGLDASYDPGKGRAVVRLREGEIDYEDLQSQHRFPAGFTPSGSSVVEWKGTFCSPYDGLHTFNIYSGGYLELWIDGQKMAERWRQCWNPVETRFTLALEKGQPHSLCIRWRPDGNESYLSVRWKKPPPPEADHRISFTSEAGRCIDYYFITGANEDSVIGGYRKLTGRAPMMPRWAYGFWQSREHYNSQKEILATADSFRDKRIPIDNLVQDWFYWKKDQWGSQRFDPDRYPDPGGMIDSLHRHYHMHFMVSVWPKFYTGTPVFKAFWDKGWLYKQNVQDHQKDWVGYVSTFYDAFNPEARQGFWDLVDKRLFSLGVDAWWLDASEPDILSNATLARKKALMNPNALGSATELFNAYPLMNDATFYDGQRAQSPDQRVFILTRSAFAGSQRYAAATWSGDIGATWQDMKAQIATGISFSLSGIPYWTMDIGGFATESRYLHPDARDLAEWREQITRWYQFGAFCPLFRAHGQAPYREPFNIAPEGSPAYRSILYYDRLRYRMLPYIYSVAGAVYLQNYTIMRGLAMDFPGDSTARNTTDEYLFGPGLLVSPVYTYGATTRPVYLPEESDWYSLYDGTFYQGGQTITASAPFSRIPVFARSGTILPLGPELQYTAEKPADTLALYVFTGRDGSFSLYEDEGLNNNYEHGAYSVIPLSYHQSTHTLSIGARSGRFEGMLSDRVFTIRWVSPGKAEGIDTGTPPEQTIRYQGKAITVTLPQGR